MDSKQQLMMQWDLLEKYAEEHTDENGVTIEYYDSYGRYPCLRVTINHFQFEMDFWSLDNSAKNEIRTSVYYQYIDKMGFERSKCFMMKRDIVPALFRVFAKAQLDYHVLPVTISTWAEAMIETVKAIRNNSDQFLKLCRLSCPYNEDGSHKYKFWKNYARVEIFCMEDNPLVQGLKGGETPMGAHVVGGNGSFRVFNKGDYGILYRVERLAGEKPRSGDPKFIPYDEYLRSLRDKLGYSRKMPYALLNAKLPERVEVITYDMDKEPEERDFVPVEYDGSWLKFLKECFKDL